jgi:hypothetical protein
LNGTGRPIYGVSSELAAAVALPAGSGSGRAVTTKLRYIPKQPSTINSQLRYEATRTTTTTLIAAMTALTWLCVLCGSPETLALAREYQPGQMRIVQEGFDKSGARQ